MVWFVITENRRGEKTTNVNIFFIYFTWIIFIDALQWARIDKQDSIDSYFKDLCIISRIV